jgi:predicted DCC family thiol-disulfide oxidoreductase YuxK
MIIAFDDHCLLCNGFVRFLLRRDARGLLRFAGATSVTGARMFVETGQDVADPAAIVLDVDGRFYLASASVLRAVAALGGLWRGVLLFLVIPAVLRDAVYDFVARRRLRWFGRAEQCPLPEPQWRERFLP